MIWFRPPVKYRAWWESPLCRLYGCGGLAARLWGRHLAPISPFIADNDKDHIKW